ncbi:DUF1700 domain-containing protein [Vagococcus xieshaowenii]|nr:DUF1700 domain-containing protein [Vagococcus xieshaowenii]
MYEHTYLQKLNDALINIPSKEKTLILTYYQELIHKEHLTDQSEETIIQALGDPVIIAAAILKKNRAKTSQSPYEQQGWQEWSDQGMDDKFDTKKSKRTRPYSKLQRVLQILGLLFINLTLMFWLFLCIGILIVCGWIVSITFVISPIILIAAYFTPYLTYPLFSLSIGCVLFGLGIVGCYLCKTLTKYFWRVTKYYFYANLHVLRGDY